MFSPAVLIDLDGTLVDTAPDIRVALNAVLISEQREPLDPPTVRYMVGRGAWALLEQAMAATGAPATAELLPELVDRFISQYREHVADVSRPFPQVPETLGRLKKSGARLAVLTNKPQVLTLPLLKALDLAHYFDVICGAGRYVFNKPDARIVAHVIEELGGVQGGAIMIGDSAVDVATARAAAIPVALLSYGYTTEPAQNLGADAVMDCFSEIPAILGKLLMRV